MTKLIASLALLLFYTTARCATPQQSIVLIQTPRVVHVSTGGGSSLQILHAWKGRSSGTGNTTATVAPTAGNTLVVFLASYGTVYANLTLTDNIDGATGWNKLAGGIEGAGPTGFSVWYKANVPSGITTLTGGGTGSQYVTIIVHEIGGTGTTPYTTGEVQADDNAGNATTTISTGAGKSSATATTIVLAGMTDSGDGGYSINASGTTGTWAYFDVTNSQESDAVNYQPTSVVYQSLTSITSEVHKWTDISVKYVACIIYIHA